MSLESQPRVSLAALPTPIVEARRLRDALGGPERAPRILIKRDDLTGLALGGNKARKLEFLMADALGQRADVVVTSGAAQSNHARLTAAAGCTTPAAPAARRRDSNWARGRSAASIDCTASPSAPAKRRSSSAPRAWSTRRRRSSDCPCRLSRRSWLPISDSSARATAFR